MNVPASEHGKLCRNITRDVHIALDTSVKDPNTFQGQDPLSLHLPQAAHVISPRDRSHLKLCRARRNGQQEASKGEGCMHRRAPASTSRPTQPHHSPTGTHIAITLTPLSCPSVTWGDTFHRPPPSSHPCIDFAAVSRAFQCPRTPRAHPHSALEHRRTVAHAVVIVYLHLYHYTIQRHPPPEASSRWPCLRCPRG